MNISIEKTVDWASVVVVAAVCIGVLVGLVRLSIFRSEYLLTLIGLLAAGVAALYLLKARKAS